MTRRPARGSLIGEGVADPLSVTGRRPTLAPPLGPPASATGAAEPVAAAAPTEPPPPIQPQ